MQNLSHHPALGREGPPLHTITVGEGPVVLVLHGGPGLDHTYLRPCLDPLGSENQLVYVDQRGHGHSPPPEDYSTLTHESWAADIDATVDELGVDHFVLFGHSWGSFIALEYATRCSDRLDGLVLCSSAPSLDYTEEAVGLARARATDRQFEALLRALSGPAPDDETFRRQWLEILPIYFASPEDRFVEGVDEGTVYSAAAFNRGMFGCMPTYDVRERLGNIAIPTLVLAGAHDWITPPHRGAEPLAAELPKGELHVFQHSGHFPMIEEEDAFLRVMRTWLSLHARSERLE